MLKLIKELREKTSCGIADCNEALKKNNNDIEKSLEWLRKQGIIKANKKNNRITSEGIVSVKIDNDAAAILEINSETDFVAKNNKFQEFANRVIDLSINADDLESLLNIKYDDNNDIKNEINNLISSIGENIKIRRFDKINLKNNAIVGNYIHNKIFNNSGEIATIIVIEGEYGDNKEEIEEIAKKIAMHIAASKPEFLNKEDVPQENIDKESEILKEQARNSGKPDKIIDKMIQGRIQKYLESIVLNEQDFVMDQNIKIKDIIADFNKKNNSNIFISSFKLFILGDGVEKKDENFADEVKKMQN